MPFCYVSNFRHILLRSASVQLCVEIDFPRKGPKVPAFLKCYTTEMSRLYLEEPTSQSKEDVWNFRTTFKAPDYITNIPGSAGLEEALVYDDWLENVSAYKNERLLPPDKVAASTFLVRRLKDKQMVGIVNIRHSLNDYLLQVGGHIGYSIGPKYRGKGYGTELLQLALEFCRSLHLDSVLVTCDVRNTPSAKVIMANGGVLENELEQNGVIKQRYWIQL